MALTMETTVDNGGSSSSSLWRENLEKAKHYKVSTE